MSIGMVGKKIGMTRIFTVAGESIPVTVIQAKPNRIALVRNEGRDGYSALQLAVDEVKPSQINKPLAGHFAKAGIPGARKLWESRVTEKEAAEYSVGSEIKLDQFLVGQWVDVAGVSKGKGFAGTIKRHHFKGQDRSHGNSLSHRVPGSIGQNQTPGRVFKGKKMAGHLGHVHITMQNLQVVRVDTEHHLIMVKGGIPGATGSDVLIKSAIKRRG